MALETLLPDPEEKTAVDPSSQTHGDTGGYRFNLLGRPNVKQKEKEKRSISPGPPVKVNLSPEALAVIKQEHAEKEEKNMSSEDGKNG